MGWGELEVYDPAVLKGVVTQTFNNIILSRDFILPSRFNIGDKVKIAFGDERTLKNCKIIKVHFSHSKVLYDVEAEVIIHNKMVESDFSSKEETLSTRLYNINSLFILPSE